MAGETFVLLEREALVPLRIPAFAIGSTIEAQPRSGGPVEAVVSAASIRPPSPVALEIADDGSGGLTIRWTRRSRTGWAWLDEVDAPLGEVRESYCVGLSSAGGAIERVLNEPFLAIAASDLAPLGSRPWTISVRQLGDHAASTPAFAQIS